MPSHSPEQGRMQPRHAPSLGEALYDIHDISYTDIPRSMVGAGESLFLSLHSN